MGDGRGNRSSRAALLGRSRTAGRAASVAVHERFCAGGLGARGREGGLVGLLSAFKQGEDIPTSGCPSATSKRPGIESLSTGSLPDLQTQGADADLPGVARRTPSGGWERGHEGRSPSPTGAESINATRTSDVSLCTNRSALAFRLSDGSPKRAPFVAPYAGKYFRPSFLTRPSFSRSPRTR